MNKFNTVFTATLNAALTVELSSTSASGDVIIYHPPTSATTNDVFVTVNGGTAPYTYTWSRVSGSATPAIYNTSPNYAVWSASSSLPTIMNAIWHCVVTDSMGKTATTPNIAVQLIFESNI